MGELKLNKVGRSRIAAMLLMSAGASGCWPGHPLTMEDFRASARYSTPPPKWELPRTVSIATFNVHDLMFVGHAKERMEFIGDQLGVLADSGALDIVCFQEAWFQKDSSILIERLAKHGLGDWHYFKSGLIGSGLLVVSRYAILEAYFHEFDEDGSVWRVWEGEVLASKGIGVVRVDVEGQILDVYDTHTIAWHDSNRNSTAYHAAERRAQFLEIIEFLSATPKDTPFVLAGDLNTACDSDEYEEVIVPNRLIEVSWDSSALDHVLVPDRRGHDYDAVPHVPLVLLLEVDGDAIEVSDHWCYVTRLTIRQGTGAVSCSRDGEGPFE